MHIKPRSQASIDLNDFIFVQDLGFGSSGEARCYKDKETEKDFFVFKQITQCTSTSFQMQQLQFQINFPSLLRYNGVYQSEAQNQESQFIISTKYFENGSLEKQIKSKSLSSTDKNIIIFGIAAGLNFLHSNNIFHGHLFPTNILLDEKNEPRISDFSLYQLHSYDTSLIFVLNKSYYLAPEQIFESTIDEKTDVFSFGILLYCILSDSLFDIDQSEQFLYLTQETQGQRFPISNNFSLFYQHLIERCWDKNPLNRPLISEILNSFNNSSEFFLPNSNIERVTQYKNKLYPNGLQTAPSQITSNKSLLLPSIRNDKLQQSFIQSIFQKNQSKSDILSITTFSPYDFALTDSEEDNKLGLITPVYAEQYIHPPRQAIPFELKRKVSLKYLHYYDEYENSQLIEPEAPQDNEQKVVVQPKETSKKAKNTKRKDNSTQIPVITNPSFEKVDKQKQIHKENLINDENLKISADCGNIESQYKFGMLLLETANPIEGSKYIKLAADSGYLRAQKEYAYLARNGSIIPQNMKIYDHYLKLAADSGDLSSQMEYAAMLEQTAKYPNSNDLQRGMSSAQIIKNAAKYYFLAAQQGDQNAQFIYGSFLEEGKGVQKDSFEALKYFKLSADQGHTFAQVKLGSLLKNSDEALHYLKLAADSSNEFAMVAYAKSILFKNSNDELIKEAFNYLQEGIRLNNSDSMFIIGCIMYYFSSYLNTKEEDNDEEDVDDNELIEYIDEEDKEKKETIKAIKTILNLIFDYYKNLNSNENNHELFHQNIGGFLRQLYANFQFKEGIEKDKSELIKVNGYNLISKAAQLGNLKAIFQCAIIPLKFASKLGFLDLTFYRNLVNPIELKGNIISSKRDNVVSEQITFFEDAWESIIPTDQTLDETMPRSLDMIIQTADGGLSDAQLLLGLLCGKNRIKRQMTYSPFEYLKMAADSGCTKAQLIYAFVMDDGHGIPKNLREAFKYYKLAADKDNYLAMISIGFMLFDGRGVNRNRKEAIKYLKQAADHNYLLATYKYAMILFNGQGVNKDIKEAIHYFDKIIRDESNLKITGIRHAETSSMQIMQESARAIRTAAEQGYSSAQRIYAIMLYRGIFFQENEQEAIKYFKKAAAMNDPISLSFIANRIFKTGDGDRSQAITMLKKAADLGYPLAQVNYAMIVEDGDEDIPQNFEEAATYYKLAADQNYPLAQLHYAFLLESGEGVEKNLELSAKYYALASRSEPEAMVRYGKMLRKGIVVNQNLKKAVKLFKKSADMGNKDGQYMYGRMLQKGEGIKCNKSLAAEMYKKAASPPYESKTLFASKAPFRYAETLLEKGDGTFFEGAFLFKFKEATEYYLQASSYEQAHEIYGYKQFEKKIFQIRNALLFILFIVFIIHKFFL